MAVPMNDSQENTLSSSTHCKPQLVIHEWLAVVIILTTLAMLTCISMIYSVDLPDTVNGEGHYLKPQFVEVYIDGAVELPGSYKITPGTKLSTVISQAKPLKTADLKRFKGAAKVRAGQVIHVPIAPQINIDVSGAVVDSGVIVVPRGTRLQDLEEYIQLKHDADKNWLRRKRFLRHGEKIEIPKRKTMQ